MQRAVKVLRIALPLAFVGFLLLVVFSFSSHRQKAAPARRVDVFDARAGDRPQVVAYAFDDTQSIGGRVVSRVRATRTVGFKSGWYTLQDVHLTVYREDGTTYEMVAPSAEFQPQTREASLAGGVTVTV